MRFASIAMVGLLCACSGGDEQVIDAATDGPSGCGDCDAPNLDAEPDGPAVCTSLAYDQRDVAAIALYEDATRINAARSFRVALEYDATPCDELAMPTWEVISANHTVAFTANVFAPRGPCPGLPIRRTRVVTLRLDAGTWTLTGTGAATPPTATVMVGLAPGTPCTNNPQPGGTCRQDCDCSAGESCIAGSGLGGPFVQCARPCELDRDCLSGSCTSVEDGLSLTCDSSMPECGGPGGACPAGYSCSGASCVNDVFLSSTTRHECSCDSDCASPLRCVQPSIPGRVARCEVACPTGGGWCSGAHACGLAVQDLAGLAPTDSVCGSLGE